MIQQLSIFDILHPPAILPPYRCGWKRCECNVVFWQDEAETPNLHPFRFWTCWRNIRRATASKINLPHDEGWRPWAVDRQEAQT
ncbi:hypothetical protein [Paracoccus aerius]|uniref:Uncharacterized protein n=1 Tax=Paracoccus aerius TaxID=1915382 RepID=A0ABS1S9S1_9RHOB|nr:hypothetical protein [Paracoccus aerius]MBL3674261.1 hypothetical protein [Paracoccus aerius]GHG24444.1 hypothetical protein GCM10017322_23000 [Paracoccus aerius]